MAPERDQQVEELFLSALERESAERASFLAEACGGDDELHREVESLLASYERAADFIEEPVAEQATRVIARSEANLLAGQQVGHYRVLELIGTGGMGEIYLAEDASLGRHVALKLLSSACLANTEIVLRFEREARSASALNHPNILTVYEIIHTETAHIIAAEFIDGVTLREQLKDGPLRVIEALEVATQVASALTAAHEGGIIHRDIKPENIMLRRRDRLVKLLDFGIAKLMERVRTDDDPEATLKTQTVRTEEGVVIGTVKYMSPEQARGQAVDARTDIWSLGCVIYEMVTGRAPFEGPTKTDQLAAILEREPVELGQSVEGVPAQLERIVKKALRKDREERYATCEEMLADLRSVKQRLEFECELERSASPDLKEGKAVTKGSRQRIGETGREAGTHETTGLRHLAAVIKRRGLSVALAAATLIVAVASMAYFSSGGGQAEVASLAVLPFVNDSADPETEYLSDGITETLINSLSPLPNLRVMSRNAVFRYKGKETDVEQVGRELNVRTVLTGRIMQRGDDFVISAELINARDGSHIWGEQYNRKLTDILAIQAEISREISENLRLKMTGEERKRLAKSATNNPEAYQLYLKGRYHWNKYNEDGLKRGVEYFKRAIDLDPGYAMAYVGLADSYYIMSNLYLPPKEAMPKARASAIKALEIDETLGEAHAALAMVSALYDWKWQTAEKEFKRAIELNPNYATAYHYYGMYLSYMGRFDESIEALSRAQQLDPLSLSIATTAHYPLHFAGRYDEAIEHLQKIIAADPDFHPAQGAMSQAYLQKGEFDRAIAHQEKKVELDRSPGSLCDLGYAYAVAGRKGEAQKILDELKELSKREYVMPSGVALVYTGLKEKDKAFEWLNKAYEERDEQLSMLKVEPRFDSLRTDPRFQDLLRRVGFAP